jgi:hypothetical protein
MKNSKNKQPLALPDDLAAAEELCQRVARDTVDLRNNIDAAESGGRPVTDPTWLFRARSALRHLIRERELLYSHVAKLRRDERRAQAKRFDRQLLAVLKERTAGDLFQSCVQEAERRVGRTAR